MTWADAGGPEETMETLLPGITARRVPTDRLTTNVLEAIGRTGPPVLFVHGNVSSSLFWQPTMLALPGGYRALAIDLRGFGDTDPEPGGATRWAPAAGRPPAGVRRPRPGAGGRHPRAARLRRRPGRHHRRARPGPGAPGRLEHGRRSADAVPGRPAGPAPGGLGDAGRPGVAVRVRRDPG